MVHKQEDRRSKEAADDVLLALKEKILGVMPKEDKCPQDDFDDGYNHYYRRAIQAIEKMMEEGKG
jgi:hypothetical protein